jgi:hypothetical protein
LLLLPLYPRVFSKCFGLRACACVGILAEFRVIAADSGVWRGLGAGLFDLSATGSLRLSSIWEIPGLLSLRLRRGPGFQILVVRSLDSWFRPRLCAESWILTGIVWLLGVIRMAGAVLHSALGFASDAEDSAIFTHGHFGRSESHAEGLLIWGYFF